MFGPHPSGRGLTDGETGLVRSIFGDAINIEPVRIHRRRWWWLHPRNVTMAPDGHLWFHPHGHCYRDDFGTAELPLQGHFIHEMTHVWQCQTGIFLPLRRHPFCRYSYSLKPGWTLRQYGLEQQAEIVRHIFLLRRGAMVAGAPPLSHYDGILPFIPVAQTDFN